eukprot:ctg_679.g166
MVSVESDLFRQHPDWALHIPSRGKTMGRNQLVLDLTREERAPSARAAGRDCPPLHPGAVRCAGPAAGTVSAGVLRDPDAYPGGHVAVGAGQVDRLARVHGAQSPDAAQRQHEDALAGGYVWHVRVRAGPAPAHRGRGARDTQLRAAVSGCGAGGAVWGYVSAVESVPHAQLRVDVRVARSAAGGGVRVQPDARGGTAGAAPAPARTGPVRKLRGGGMVPRGDAPQHAHRCHRGGAQRRVPIRRQSVVYERLRADAGRTAHQVRVRLRLGAAECGDGGQQARQQRAARRLRRGGLGHARLPANARASSAGGVSAERSGNGPAIRGARLNQRRSLTFIMDRRRSGCIRICVSVGGVRDSRFPLCVRDFPLREIGRGRFVRAPERVRVLCSPPLDARIPARPSRVGSSCRARWRISARC